MVGIGIRLAQDVGAHRRKTRSGPFTVEDELWKRAFWYAFRSYCGMPAQHLLLGSLFAWIVWSALPWVDPAPFKTKSRLFGQPSCAAYSDLSPSFDIEMPIECDDEYWEDPDPDQRWRQPPGKPSLITAFNLYLKLNQVLAFSLRTIVGRFSASSKYLLTMIPVLHQ